MVAEGNGDERAGFNPNVATLLVYDILNAEVLRRSVAPVDWDSLPDRLLQDMVNVQLNSTRSQARVVNARGGQIMLLSAPILHRGSPEGVALSIANLARFEGAANGLLEIRVLRPDEAMLGPDIQVQVFASYCEIFTLPKKIFVTGVKAGLQA